METEEKKNPEKEEKEPVMWMPICMCLGLSVGLAFGNFLFENGSTGMCIGLALGVGIGSLIDAKNRKKASDNSDADKDE